MNIRQLGRRLIADHPWWSATIILSIITLVISGIRNHEGLIYPYGYRAKERFRVRGQLFER